MKTCNSPVPQAVEDSGIVKYPAFRYMTTPPLTNRIAVTISSPRQVWKQSCVTGLPDGVHVVKKAQPDKA